MSDADKLTQLAAELDLVHRFGEAEDAPEGTRYVQMSDTLAKRIADQLRAAAAEITERSDERTVAWGVVADRDDTIERLQSRPLAQAHIEALATIERLEGIVAHIQSEQTCSYTTKPGITHDRVVVNEIGDRCGPMECAVILNTQAATIKRQQGLLRDARPHVREAAERIAADNSFHGKYEIPPLLGNLISRIESKLTKGGDDASE